MLKHGWAKPVELGQIDHLGHLLKAASCSGWHLLAQPDQEVMDAEHDSVVGNSISGHGGAFIESSQGCHLFPNPHYMSFDIPSILFFQPSNKREQQTCTGSFAEGSTAAGPCPSFESVWGGSSRANDSGLSRPFGLKGFQKMTRTKQLFHVSWFMTDL